MDGPKHITAVLSALGLAVLVAITVLSSIPASGGLQNQNNQSQARRHPPDLERWPITDYNASLPADPKERARRQARNKTYDKKGWGIYPDDIADSAVRVDYVDRDLPAFPVRKSNVILIGQISHAAAFVSNDKTGVYSEFTVVVEDVLKNDLAQHLPSGSLIDVSREGGRIRFPSGRVRWYAINEQNMPSIGHRYVLFLARAGDDMSLTIVTGYELEAGKVIPLDHLHNMIVYEDADEIVFLKTLRASLTNP